MNPVTAVVLYLALLHSVHGETVSINHDQVQPFAQPEPVTISEKAAVKFKPQLQVVDGCVSFPVVNAAGEISGGLKGTKEKDGCTEAPLGSQVYGRASWYRDQWAIVYAWYFPKNFRAFIAKACHGWASMVLWLDNPAVEEQKLLGASLSQQTLKEQKLLFISMTERNEEPYQKYNGIPSMGFVGMQAIRDTRLARWRWNYTYVGGSNVSTRVAHMMNHFDWIHLSFAGQDGESQDLIMWEQLTEEARAALNSADFGDSSAPFTDNNFKTTLEKAWPF
ncbi:hypothetical protein V7S43_018387 [Phytophthora oleae]|uniref:Necrosis inducing-like protein NPP1 type n=1 Tax=Phytophthora oleae TaxID=2107226 RepID=A0ABD3EQL8_9STRA